MTVSLVIALAALAIWLYLMLARGFFWRAAVRDDWDAPALATWPAVTAVVPARDEADVIGESLASLLRQDYPGAFDVILIDDQSRDGTADVVRRTAAELERVSSTLTHNGAADAACSLPPCGGGLGRGVARSGSASPHPATPTPDPSPQGGGEPTEFASRADSISSERARGAADRLTVLPGQPLPAGWTGKLWAMKQGVEHAEASAPRYLLLTDADIAYAPDALRRLVAHAEGRGLVLASLMAKLRCESLAERGLVPAFIFFFEMLYPFAWVNRPGSATAGAAGGCMLARRDALRAAGGIDAIHGELIDDCALARALKARGPIWLALTDRVTSLRPYPHLGDIRRMVARSAYCQLQYSPLLLAGTVAGMGLTYLAAPLLALFGSGWPQALGALVWLMMAVAFQPVLRFYRVSPLWGVALPGIALAYLAFTLDSAYQHARGRGGLWKGRVQAKASGT